MRVRLKDLRPNPWRRNAVDPVDQSVVAMLAASVKAHGFWGGVVLRRVAAGIEIVAGQHRVLGAIRAGVATADLEVREGMSDTEAVLIYATENSSQHGESSTAGTGTVAAATWLLARAIMRGTLSTIVEKVPANSAESLRGNIASEKGLGAPIVLEFLKNVPGMQRRTVEDYFANIKACGEYARIIDEVGKEIDAEFAEELRLAEKARKAAEAAEAARLLAEEERNQADLAAKMNRNAAARKGAERARQRTEQAAKLASDKAAKLAAESAKFEPARVAKLTATRARQAVAKRVVKTPEGKKIEIAADPTFDFKNVAEHFKNPSQLRAFRNIVTAIPNGATVPTVPFAKQAPLAALLIKFAATEELALSDRVIKNAIEELLLPAAERAERAAARKERRHPTGGEADPRNDRRGRMVNLIAELQRMATVETDLSSLFDFRDLADEAQRAVTVWSAIAARLKELADSEQPIQRRR